MNPVYCRPLEYQSGFIVTNKTKGQNDSFLPDAPHGGRDRWELVLGVGETRREAWKDYLNRK
jgi:hypothetical protein